MSHSTPRPSSAVAGALAAAGDPERAETKARSIGYPI
jgi:hypothetical protein